MSTRRPNLVVIMCHDLGQHLGCYGRSEVRSANLDAFAAAGVRFANSFCVAPQCSPSRAGFWTGRYPHANGVVGLTHAGFKCDLHPGEHHLAQILDEAGYDTRLFAIQHEANSPARCGYAHHCGRGRAPAVADSFIDFIRTRSPDDPQPFLASVGFFEPHRPWPHEGVEPHAPGAVEVLPYLPDIPEVREDLVALEASVASVDQAIGRMIEALDLAGLVDDTIVVFTTDHGVALPHAKMTLYDPGIEVALMMRGPGLSGGRVFTETVSNIDVFPTLLELLDLPVPDNLHGRSFADLLRGRGGAGRDAIFAEKTYHSYYDPMRCIRTERWKLITNFSHAPAQEISNDYANNFKGYVETLAAQPPETLQHPPLELYDLEADPVEQHNLAADPAYREVLDELVPRLRQWMADTDDPLLAGPMADGAYEHRMARFKAW